jgi:hypothetical protein
MELSRNSSHPTPVLSQTENNTTLWIGHLSSNPNEHLGGQTFTCPADGILNNIQVYTSSVQNPGELMLSVHEFDCQSRTWGPVIARAGKIVDKSDEARWIRFELEPVNLQKNACYGFRLETQDAFVGLGEAVSHARKPFSFGLSWNGNDRNAKGKYFSYFSLAFKVEMCA